MLTPHAPDQRPTTAPHEFVPRFCPRASCPAHTDPEGTHAFSRHGSFTRIAPPGVIPRFWCHTGGHTFSTQTFSPTYYLKRPELLVPVASQAVNGSGDRHIRRDVPANPHYAPKPNVGAAQSTITRLIPRLGRECSLFNNALEELAASAGPPRYWECFAIDDFETFVLTQLVQVSVPTVVGDGSRYVYQLDQAPHRRGGTRTGRKQRVERGLARRGAFPRGARRRAWKRVFDDVLRIVGPDCQPEFWSDGDRVISDALDALGERVKHQVFPNPPRGRKRAPGSDDAQRRNRALRAVDHLHRFFRHSLAHDRRETIAFARSVNGMLSRKLMFQAYRNVIQPRREAYPDEGTPAMWRRLVDRPLGWGEILEMRRFRRRMRSLPPGWTACYEESIELVGQRPSRRRFPGFAR